MTKKEFEKWLSDSPGKSAWGLAKLTEISGLPFKEVNKIVLPFRLIYRESLKNRPPVVKDLKADLKKSEVSFKHEFQNVNSKTGEYNIPGVHIVFPCVHVPHENHPLMRSALKLMADLDNVKGFHIIGDFLDMSALSSHDKGNVSHNTLDEEYKAGNEVLDNVEEVLPEGILKTYIYGNHEDRYFRYMRNVDNAKLGSALQSPTAALRLNERGYHVFQDWKNSYITLGSYLTLCHGEFTNVHTAKKHLDTYRKSVMFAHTHRKQVYIEGNNGGYNIGSMANFHSEAFNYATRAMKESWVNAFAIVTIDNDGHFHVEIPTWHNDKLVFGGKTY